MRIVRNARYVRGRQRAAKLMVFLGLVLLFGSWAVYMVSPAALYLPALLGLAIGFVMFNGGMQQVARWLRRPRSDQAIDAELRQLNDRYTVIHYPDIPGRRPDHLLITPNGLLVLTSREAHGRFSVNGKRWRHHRNPLSMLFQFGGPQLGNPTLENEEQRRAVTAFLQQEGVAVEPQGAIVFVADNVEIEMENSPVPVLHISELLDHVRSLPGDTPLSSAMRERLATLLARGDELERIDTTAQQRPRKRVKAA